MPRATRLSAFLPLACALLTPASTRAQGAMPTCATLLPADTIARVAGEPFRDLGDCEWGARLGTPGARTLSVGFFDVVALKASPGYASPEEYFESVVSSVEGRAAAKRELLPGVGMKAAFVPAPPQMLVAVQRQDGVARLVGINFTKAQMIALARALAAQAHTAAAPAPGPRQATAVQGKEQRITGAALVAHPVAALAAQYLDLLHGGKMDAAMALATTQAQAAWNAEPASEQKASADFRRRLLPTRADVERSLLTQGVLIIEANGAATLNLVKSTPASGSGTATASTVAMPFVMEGGKWKVAR